MDVLISAYRQLAIVAIEGPEYWLIRYPYTSKRDSVSAHQVQMFLGTANDVQGHQVAQESGAILRLENACIQTRCVQLVLHALDPTLAESVRADVLAALDGQFALLNTRQLVESVFYAAPLPDHADMKNAQRIAEVDKRLRVRGVLYDLAQSQAAIATAHHLWNLLPPEYFGGRRGLCTREAWQAAASREGLFRAIVNGEHETIRRAIALTSEAQVLFLNLEERQRVEHLLASFAAQVVDEIALRGEDLSYSPQLDLDSIADAAATAITQTSSRVPDDSCRICGRRFKSAYCLACGLDASQSHSSGAGHGDPSWKCEPSSLDELVGQVAHQGQRLAASPGEDRLQVLTDAAQTTPGVARRLRETVPRLLEDSSRPPRPDRVALTKLCGFLRAQSAEGVLRDLADSTGDGGDEIDRLVVLDALAALHLIPSQFFSDRIDAPELSALCFRALCCSDVRQVDCHYLRFVKAIGHDKRALAETFRTLLLGDLLDASGVEQVLIRLLSGVPDLYFDDLISVLESIGLHIQYESPFIVEDLRVVETKEDRVLAQFSPPASPRTAQLLRSDDLYKQARSAPLELDEMLEATNECRTS